MHSDSKKSLNRDGTPNPNAELVELLNMPQIVKPQEVKAKAKKLPYVEPEPLGEFDNPYGKPKVAHDDEYLNPFVDDLFLRQNEYRK